MHSRISCENDEGGWTSGTTFLLFVQKAYGQATLPHLLPSTSVSFMEIFLENRVVDAPTRLADHFLHRYDLFSIFYRNIMQIAL